MNYSYRGKILEIEDARIIFRNFKGEASKYNAKGNRNFSVVIPDKEMAMELKNDGWNVKDLPPREPGDDPLFYIPVKVKYNDYGRGPAAYIESGNNVTRLNEETIGTLDEIEILSVSMDLRPFEWELADGKSGTAAYLQAIKVVQNIDRFGAKYAEDDLPF